MILGTQAADFIEHYQRALASADDVWSHHRQAMQVYDVEDAIAIGLHIMRQFLRFMEEWHSGVSDSPENYDAALDAAIQELEGKIIQLEHRTLHWIEKLTGAGFQFKDEAEFRRTLAHLETCASGIRPDFQRSTLRTQYLKAVEDHANGHTEAPANPWS